MTAAEQSSIAKRTRLLAEAPAFRPVAMQLLKLVRSSSQSLTEIVTLLRSDAVLTGEVLRLANSPLFATRCEIKNVLQALAFLGLDRINAMVLTTVIRGLVDGRRGSFTHSCWRHNLATGLICQRLSAAACLPQERCYVAGLIHDIGRLALLRVFPEYEQAMIQAESGGDDLLARERELFDVDHAEAGRWLLSQWGCPLELQNVAAWHENPQNTVSCDRPLICLVHAASQLADLMAMSVFPSIPRADLPEIVDWLPAKAGEHVLDTFPEMVEWVETKVNEIELSLT
ncbi:putative Metal dependent phosphohydrolase [Candidatus Sulfopaludibacter sp. SbA3]|nr:putative Metal dependent phosphohydrolase [Candidatus Sulfopaludibacter sp. SbA3]